MKETISEFESEYELDSIEDIARTLLAQGWTESGIEELLDVVEAVIETGEQPADVADALSQVVDMGLPLDDIKSVFENKFLDDDENLASLLGDTLHITDLEGGDFGDLSFRVVDELDVDHNGMEQMVVVGNEDGTNLFKVWENEDVDAPTLTEGESFHAQNVVGDEYDGDVTLQTTQYSDIEQLDADIEVDNSADLEFDDLIVQGLNTSKSGLIKRCSASDCSRTLKEGQCSDHGNVDPEHDVRAVLETEEGTIFLQAEHVEKVVEMSVEDAKQTMAEELDRSATVEPIEEALVGKVIAGSANEAWGDYHAEEIELEEIDAEATADDAAALLDAHGD